MNDFLSVQVKNNSNWVRCYNRLFEKELLLQFFKQYDGRFNQLVNIIDIGCGNGRSALLLRELFGNKGVIHGIDKCKENIFRAKQLICDPKTSFETADAYNYFSSYSDINKFDIAFFSWSLFDMCNEEDFLQKEARLCTLINMVKKCLTPDGLIVVLQPTKGGVFEQLLSKFMPGSDADYEMVHNFLMKSGFDGAESAFPKPNDSWTIWSEFLYSSIDEVFWGVSSILYLEQKRVLSRDEFDRVFYGFLKEHDIELTELKLTDCVNLYYIALGE